jgi:pantoate kinase
LYERGTEAAELLATPDFDSAEIAETITAKLMELRKHPELQRCGKALDRIAESVGMFKENFSKYYQTLNKTGNMTLMLQDYITDVMQETKGEAELAMQFRQLIAFFRDKIKSQDAEPVLKDLATKIADNLDDACSGVDK